MPQQMNLPPSIKACYTQHEMPVAAVEKTSKEDGRRTIKECWGGRVLFGLPTVPLMISLPWHCDQLPGISGWTQSIQHLILPFHRPFIRKSDMPPITKLLLLVQRNTTRELPRWTLPCLLPISYNDFSSTWGKTHLGQLPLLLDHTFGSWGTPTLMLLTGEKKKTGSKTRLS